MHKLLALLAAALVSGSALAQSFPSRAIHIVVPFPPGGGTDVVARAVAPVMQDALGQPVVVENRSGAGGNIGTDAVARAEADGYTLLVASAATAINNTFARKNITWDVTRDFAPVVLLVLNQSLLVANPGFPPSSVKALIAAARAKPGTVTFASYGNGSSAHLIGELFKMMAKIDVVHVPYKGAAPAVNDVMGGQVNYMFADVAAVLPQVKAGRLKALAIGSAQRFPGLPDVPTVSEAGVPGFEGGGFLGLIAPKGTPSAAIHALNQAALKSLADPKVHERLVALATIPSGGTPEQFGRYLGAEVRKWAEVMRANDIHQE